MNDRKFTSYASIMIVLAVFVTVTSGVLDGRMSRQWGVEKDFEHAANALADLPSQFGGWHLESKQGLGDSAMDLLQCRAFINHSYRNADTGQLVTVAVMVGPGAKMSIHVPEICFEAKNYSLVQDRERIRVDSPTAVENELWSVVFQLNDVSEQRINVYYGWKADEHWVAPTMPRWSVAGNPVLYKLQLSEQVTTAVDGSEGGALGFLESFLPVLDERLQAVRIP
ncbi:MAG: exosortase-associated EpsI family protein [Planctomycetaceae bacterium]|nr:exosortase-associated EpsI family protein [Planctomycetaceae bacterium]